MQIEILTVLIYKQLKKLAQVVNHTIEESDQT